jgi:hypothetical protein
MYYNDDVIFMVMPSSSHDIQFHGWLFQYVV